VRSLIARGIVPANRRGHRLGLQSELARYFGVTRQRVSQVWAEERERAA
jgi:DNA-binding transcriptional regulator YdaS (Cro superfamily)